MAKYVIDSSTLTAIADSIRAKKGTTADITPESMPVEIAGIAIAKALIRNGSGYIDTGVDGANSNLTIEIQYEFITFPTGYWTLIRAYTNESTNSTRIIFYQRSNTYCCLNSVPSSSLALAQTRYAGVVYTDVLKPVSSTNFTYTTNGVTVTKTRISGDPLVGKNLTLFVDLASADGVNVKVYYLKIYDGDTLIRDYVPFITQSGECGMYDFVTKKFYGNDGVGAFDAEQIRAIEDYPEITGGATNSNVYEIPAFVGEKGDKGDTGVVF